MIPAEVQPAVKKRVPSQEKLEELEAILQAPLKKKDDEQKVVHQQPEKEKNLPLQSQQKQMTVKQLMEQLPPPSKEKLKAKNVVKKFAFATRIGYQPNNPDKVNQDSFILAPNIQDRPAFHLFGVCDGHGQCGRDASTFVKFAL